MSTTTVARIEVGVYARTRSSDARVRLLRETARDAERIELHAPLSSDGTYKGRLAYDVPRRIARAMRLRAPEPGDRFSSASEPICIHAFFDDEEIIHEADRAGLGFVERRGSWVVLSRQRHPPEHPRPFAEELVRVLYMIRRAERQRHESPEKAVKLMRLLGARERTRGLIGRARLRRAIGWVDAMIPFRGGPNCYRRVLAEIALDAGAANETLVFGLDVGRTGHVSFKEASQEERTFDVAFELGP